MGLSLGISPCPNDTYIFSALIEGRVPVPRDIGPWEPHFADVEELNVLAKDGMLDVTKLSASAAAGVLDEYVILDAGGALGCGCGPLLVAAQPLTEKDLSIAPIAVPGALTTANLLLSLHGGFSGPRHEKVFDEIIPAVVSGECVAGLIIHESRFTYAAHGLHLVADLGGWWEKATSAPIPLGVIAAKRSLGYSVLSRIESLIRQSLERANANPGEGRAFIRSHAQEMDDVVLEQHIAMFVNEYSLRLGPSGRDAVERLLRHAARIRNIHLPEGRPVFLQQTGENRA